MLQLATRHPDSRGGFAHRAEIDFERTLTIKRAQSADAIAQPCKQNRELGAIYNLSPALQFGRRDKADASARYLLWNARQIEYKIQLIDINEIGRATSWT